MIDWTQPMTRTYEFYEVNPTSWNDVKKIHSVIDASITRSTTAETCGSASFTLGESIDECYMRTYMAVTQGDEHERVPLGVHLLTTSSTKFDGKSTSVSVDGYTPLLELKETQPPLGYCVLKDSNVMEMVVQIVGENMRAPVVAASSDKTMPSNFVAESDDTWLDFVLSLVSYAEKYIDLDDRGRVIFQPKTSIDKMQPVWTFNDDNSSLLYPDVSMDIDLYAIPNVVEVLYSDSKNYFYTRVVNDDPNSPTSTVRRGREIINRVTSPTFSGVPSAEMVKDYAERLLEQLSTAECEVQFSHGYCPVRPGDCVRLNYSRSAIGTVKAIITEQRIRCDTACNISETAIFSKKFWSRA